MATPALSFLPRDVTLIRTPPTLIMSVRFSFVHMLEAGSEHSRFRKRLSLHTAGQRPNMDARAQATEAGRGSGPGG